MLRLRLPRSWRSRAAVVLVLVAGYVALVYGIAHTRASRPATDGPPMLTPVISEKGERRGDALIARPAAVAIEDDSIPPARHWVFSPIDLWPSAANRPPTLSGFTPVSDARADPRDIPAAAPAPSPRPGDKPRLNRSTLRMVRWLRPEYPADSVPAGAQGSVVLDLMIDADGKPVQIAVAQGSGSLELDRAATSAASSWRFAPPRWNSQPVEVWGRIEVRFHRQ